MKSTEDGRSGRGSMHHIDLSKGLHVIKDCFQKRYLRDQCIELKACLHEAIESTRNQAPVRNTEYLRIRKERERSTRRREAKLEDDLYRRWREKTCNVKGCWSRIVGFQVNLQEKDDDPWGQIDLLGVSAQGLPVVIELKAAKSTDTLVKMLVQAAAYGVALQKAWQGEFRNEWIQKTGGTPGLMPPKLPGCQLVCAASDDYWEEWVGNSPKAETVAFETWKAIGDLRNAFKDEGFPATFVRLRLDPEIVILPGESS